MLVLSRKRDERIELSGGIVITVVGIRGDKVRLGIAAPPHIEIWRSELLDRPVQQTLELDHA